jgi:hypothetical protein
MKGTLDFLTISALIFGVILVLGSFLAGDPKEGGHKIGLLILGFGIFGWLMGWIR